MDDLQRFEIKVPATRNEGVEAAEFVPVLQKWIQDHSVEGTLIDVADYSHIHHGAGVILVGHECNVSIDYSGGQMGLLYRRRQPTGGEISSRILKGLAAALRACSLLEKDGAFSGRLAFDPGSWVFTANDRLTAQAEDGAFSAIESILAGALGHVYQGGVTLERVEDDERARPSVRVSANKTEELEALAQKCEARAGG